MPLYDCRCQNDECRRMFEVIVPLNEANRFDKQRSKKNRCPGCQGKLKRLMSPPRIIRIN